MCAHHIIFIPAQSHALLVVGGRSCPLQGREASHKFLKVMTLPPLPSLRGCSFSILHKVPPRVFKGW